MNQYDYVVGLLTIVSGLAVSELAVRLSKLMEHRRTIRWDWMPLLCALLGLGALVLNWVMWWHPENALPANYTIGSFIVSLAANLLLYLTVATSLPSEPQPGIDLRAFYDQHRRTFWLLFTATIVQWDLRYWLLPALGGEALPTVVIVIGVPVLLLSGALVFWRNRLFNTVATLALIGLVVGPLLPQAF